MESTNHVSHRARSLNELIPVLKPWSSMQPIALLDLDSSRCHVNANGSCSAVSRDLTEFLASCQTTQSAVSPATSPASSPEMLQAPAGRVLLKPWLLSWSGTAFYIVFYFAPVKYKELLFSSVILSFLLHSAVTNTVCIHHPQGRITQAGFERTAKRIQQRELPPFSFLSFFKLQRLTLNIKRTSENNSKYQDLNPGVSKNLIA